MYVRLTTEAVGIAGGVAALEAHLGPGSVARGLLPGVLLPGSVAGVCCPGSVARGLLPGVCCRSLWPDPTSLMSPAPQQIVPDLVVSKGAGGAQRPHRSRAGCGARGTLAGHTATDRAIYLIPVRKVNYRQDPLPGGTVQFWLGTLNLRHVPVMVPTPRRRCTSPRRGNRPARDGAARTAVPAAPSRPAVRVPVRVPGLGRGASVSCRIGRWPGRKGQRTSGAGGAGSSRSPKPGCQDSERPLWTDSRMVMPWLTSPAATSTRPSAPLRMLMFALDRPAGAS